MKLFELPESLRFGESFFRNDDFRIGCLDNGLKYYIRHNDEGPGLALVGLLVKVGSMQEEEHERGLAHFLEHSVFKGSKNFPGHSLDDFLRSNGLLIGDNYNACTSQNSTIYYINDIKVSTPGLLDSCLQVMADFSGNAFLDDEALETERGIVRSEYINSHNMYSRMMETVGPVLLQNARNAYRAPIGLLDVIENFEYDSIRKFYRKWYHPLNQAVVAVGDFDVDDMEALIREKFSAFASPVNPAPVLNYGISANNEPIFVDATDHECYSTSFCMFFKDNSLAEAVPSQDAVCYQLFVDLMMGLFSQLFRLRISSLLEQPGNPYQDLGCHLPSSFFGDRNTKSLKIICNLKESREVEGYSMLLAKLMQASRYGFTQDELDFVRSSVMAGIDKLKDEFVNVTNYSIFHDCQDNFLNGLPLFTPETISAFVKAFWSQLNVKTFNEMFAKFVNDKGSNMLVYSFGPEVGSKLKSDTMRELAKSAFRGGVSELDSVELNFSLMDNLPADGNIAERRYNEASDSYEWILQNGARVVYKITHNAANSLRFRVASLGGASVFDDCEYPNLKIFDDVVYNSGLASLSGSQLNKFLNDKNVDYGIDFYEHYQVIRGTSSMTYLETMMQILHCMFTNPGFNDGDFQIFMEDKRQEIINRNANPENFLNKALERLRYVKDNRMRRVQLQDLDKISNERCLEMWKNLMRDASTYTFFFVGEIDVDRLEELVRRYIASLPSTYEGVRMRPGVARKERLPLYHRETIKLDEPKSRYYCNYVLTALPDTIQTVVLFNLAQSLLDQIINDEIRTRRSWCYYHKVTLTRNWNVDDISKIDITLSLDLMLLPERGQCAQIVLDRLLDAVSPQKINSEMFEGVKSNLITSHNQELTSNKYWVWALEQLYSRDKNFFDGYCGLVEQASIVDVCKTIRYILSHSIKQAYLMVPEGVDQLTAND